MRFDVRYRTLITYSEQVVESNNEVRARPADTPWQTLVNYELTVSPTSRIHQFTDGWGTTVDSFGIRAPHDAMEVIATATVETRPDEPAGPDIDLDALDEPAFADAHHEYLTDTRATEADHDIAALAMRLRADASGCLELANAVADTVSERLEYAPGSTDVGTTAAEAFHLRRGVCQDHAHLAAALARPVGLPTRYVSGYFFTSDNATGADTDADLVLVQTHAWVEMAIPGHGWVAIDPTNRKVPGERHVKIGHGPDYEAVMPFRGVFSGPASSEVHAAVQIRRSGRIDDTPRTFTTGTEAELRRRLAERAIEPPERFAQQQQQQQQQ